MRHSRWKVPAWLLAVGIVLAIAIHVVLFLQLGARVTMLGALGIAASVLVVKHLGLVGWSRRTARGPEAAEMTHDDGPSCSR